MFESFSIDLALRFKHSIPSSRKEKEGEKKHKKEKRKRMCEVFNLFIPETGAFKISNCCMAFPGDISGTPRVEGVKLIGSSATEE